MRHRPLPYLFLAIVLFAGVLLLSLGRHPALAATPGPAHPAAGPRAAQETTPTPDPLPDLLPRHASIGFESGDSCDWAHSDFGIRTTIANVGGALAGPFLVEINGVRQAVGEGLAAGGEVRLFSPGYVAWGVNTVIVDVTGLVAESNEENNTFSQMLPIPTAPATCTPTPTVTPTRVKLHLPLILHPFPQSPAPNPHSR